MLKHRQNLLLYVTSLILVRLSWNFYRNAPDRLENLSGHKDSSGRRRQYRRAIPAAKWDRGQLFQKKFFSFFWRFMTSWGRKMRFPWKKFFLKILVPHVISIGSIGKSWPKFFFLVFNQHPHAMVHLPYMTHQPPPHIFGPRYVLLYVFMLLFSLFWVFSHSFAVLNSFLGCFYWFNLCSASCILLNWFMLPLSVLGEFFCN